MASLAFDSYIPHPSIQGAYSFNPSGGGAPVLAGGDAAERLRQLIDRSPAPQPLAFNQDAPFGSTASVPDTGPAPVMASQAPAPQAAPPGANMSSVSGAPVAALAPNVSAAPEVAAQEGRPTPEISRTLVHPSAGQQEAPVAANPGQAPDLSRLDEMYRVVHTKGGMTPSGKKVTTEGGIQDPAIAKLTSEAYASKMRADADYAEAAKAQGLAQVHASQIAAADAAKEVEALNKQQLARQSAMVEGDKEYNRIMAIKQGELESAGKREVDQFRLYRGKPGAQIGAAIAGALGAFGSSLTHGPNFALDIINRQIDNDVQAQREEINRGVAGKQNDIARLRDKYQVDNNTAEKLLRISLTEKAQALAQRQAALQGGQEAQQRLIGLDQQLAANNIATAKGIKDDILGKVTASTEAKYHMGGDSIQLNPIVQGRVKAAEATGKLGKAMGEAAKGDYEASHEGQAPPKAGAGGPGKAPARLSNSLGINEAALEDTDNFLKDRPKGFIRRPGTIESHTTGRLLTSDERDKVDTMTSAIVGKIVMGSNGSINEKEAEHFAEMLNSPYEAVARAGAEELKRALTTTNKALHRAIARSSSGGGVDAAISDAAEEAASSQ